jgi:hypothetical protein
MLGWFMGAIETAVSWAIAHPWPAIGAALALLAARYTAGQLLGVLSIKKGRRR